MELKRVFDRSTGEPVLDHVRVNRYTKKQNFTQKFINESVANGLMTMGNGVITLHTSPELSYNIIRTPGHYCCFDDKRMGDHKAAQDYIQKNYAGQTSPDLNNPSGYRKDNFFACELIGE